MNLSVFFAHLVSAANETGKPLFELLKFAKSIGYSGVDVDARELNNESFSLIDRAGLKVSCICQFFDFAHNPDNTAAFKTLETAEKLQTKFMLLPGFINEGEDLSAAGKKMMAAIEPVAAEAEKRGVTLCIEDMDSALSPYANTEDLLTFFREIPSLYCTFDIGNFAAAGDDILSSLETLLPYVVHVHCKDKTFTPCLYTAASPKIMPDGKRLYDMPTGRGVLPIKAVTERLLNNGFDGYFTVEMFGVPNMKGALEKAANFMLGK